MNERIEHITKQVDEYFDDLTIEFSREAWMEKFAELIVQECAKFAKKEQAFNARYTDADKHPRVNIDQCILIEFGL